MHLHNGTVTGDVWTASPLGPTQNWPLAGMTVTRTPPGDNTVTNATGGYGFTGGGTAMLQGNLDGPNLDVQNQAGPTLQAAGSGTPAAPVNLNFPANNEAARAQVSAFYWTNRAREFAQSILIPPPPILSNLPVRVNINDASAAAFYDQLNPSLNFFLLRRGLPQHGLCGCRVARIRARRGRRERRHSRRRLQRGLRRCDWHPGNTPAPASARDFSGSGTCLRQASDMIMWPPAPGEDVHYQGRRYAGFAWELIQQLRGRYSDDQAYDIAARLILAAAAGNPSNIPDAVFLELHRRRR